MSEKQYYLTEVKYKKSLNFLFPLLGFQQGSTPPKETFLYWGEIDECIDDYVLLVHFKTDYDEDFQKFEAEQISTKESLVGAHTTTTGKMYLFDLITFYSDVDNFLHGRYSKLKAQTKRIIMGYFGNPDDQRVEPGRPIHMALYPDLYRKLVAEELGDDIDPDSLDELANKYDITEEICYLEIK